MSSALAVMLPASINPRPGVGGVEPRVSLLLNGAAGRNCTRMFLITLSMDS